MMDMTERKVNELLKDLCNLLELANEEKEDTPHAVRFCEGQNEDGFAEEESVAMLFYDAETCRVFPFEHVLRICPWLTEHGVMRPVPELEDIYYLYEEGTEVETDQGMYLVGPVVVIRLNEDHFLITPEALDRHRIRKFIRENTETVDFADGGRYEAFQRV